MCARVYLPCGHRAVKVGNEWLCPVCANLAGYSSDQEQAEAHSNAIGFSTTDEGDRSSGPRGRHAHANYRTTSAGYREVLPATPVARPLGS